MAKNIKEIGKELLGKSLNSYHKKTGLTQLEKNNEMQDGILNGILSQVDDAYIEKTEQSNVIHLDGSGDGVVALDSIEGNTMVNLASLKRMTRFASTGNMVCDYDGIYYKGSFYNTYYVSSIAQQPLSTLGMQQGKTYTLIQYQKLDKSIYNDDTTTPRRSGFIFYDKSSGASVHLGKDALSEMINVGETKITKTKFTVDSRATHFDLRLFTANKSLASKEVSFSYWFILLEGDYTNKEVNFFECLQSSFEEKVNEDGKCEIEILSHNINHFDNSKISLKNLNGWRIPTTITYSDGVIRANNGSDADRNCSVKISIPTIYLTPRVQKVYISCMARVTTGTCNLEYSYVMNSEGGLNAWTSNVGDDTVTTTWKRITKVSTLLTDMIQNQYLYTMFGTMNLPTNATLEIKDIIVSYVEPKEFIPLKQNKIKLLINEPLRATDTVKDKICIKDNKLVIERNCGEVIFNGEENWQDTWQNSGQDTYIYFHLTYSDFGNYAKYPVRTETIRIVSDYFNNAYCGSSVWGNNTGEKVAVHSSVDDYYFQVSMLKSNLSSLDKQGFKNFIKSRNGLKFVYKLEEPYYEEVLNEYGEPILLEGYENGTIYIDSAIVPTTTIRYTPKMESFKTVKEVGNNNIMLTNDINNTIVPYMMEVDLMIMEKEVALMSQKNIRKIGAEDMTSMQKRTQQMLERLIKGKSLTEQECKTRVTTYLNANKITDEQAKELNFLIDEIYA